jgi:hypothetical protein
MFQGEKPLHFTFVQDAFSETILLSHEPQRSSYVKWEISEAMGKTEQALDDRQLAIPCRRPQSSLFEIIGESLNVAQGDAVQLLLHNVQELLAVGLVDRSRSFASAV